MSPQLFNPCSLPFYHFCFVFKDPPATDRQRTLSVSLERTAAPASLWGNPFPAARKVSKHVSFKYAQRDEARNNGDWYLEKEFGSGNLNKAMVLQSQFGLCIPIRERHKDSATSSHNIEYINWLLESPYLAVQFKFWQRQGRCLVVLVIVALLFSVQWPAAEPHELHGLWSSVLRHFCKWFCSKQMWLSYFGRVWYLCCSRVKVVQQYNRGVVQHEKVMFKESSCKVSQAGICKCICIRGEMRIFIFCLVQVSHHCTDRYAGTEPGSRRTDVESRGIIVVPIATTEIDSFKQTNYRCASTLRWSWTSNLPPSK